MGVLGERRWWPDRVVLDDTIEPGTVLDTTADLDGEPAGYQAMTGRKITP